MSDWYVAESSAYGVSIRTKARTFRPIVAKNSPTRTEDGYVATRMKRDEAELTVRAVNAHDALLEAATAVLGLGVVPTTQPEYRMLEAAIHLAKGNQP